jgi:hypothetical protein
VTADGELLKALEGTLTLNEGCISETQRAFSRITEHLHAHPSCAAFPHKIRAGGRAPSVSSLARRTAAKPCSPTFSCYAIQAKIAESHLSSRHLGE